MTVLPRVVEFIRDTLTLPKKLENDNQSANMTTGIVTSIVGVAIAAFLFLCNPYFRPFEGYYLVNCVVLFWLPCIVVMGFLRQSPAEFGLVSGDRRTGWIWTAVSYACMLPILLIASHMHAFSAYYLNRLEQPLTMVGSVFQPNWLPHVQIIALVYYESVMGCYLFCWEFFFRGFLLFGLARLPKVGPWGAILLQAIPFTLLHWSLVSYAAKPPQIASAFVGGIALGILALRTRTFYYGFLIHWLIALTLDLLLLAGAR